MYIYKEKDRKIKIDEDKINDPNDKKEIIRERLRLKLALKKIKEYNEKIEKIK